MKRILWIAAALAVSYAAFAQTAPPIKMGLWQTTTVSKMTGLELPPEVVERMKAMGRSLPGAEPRTTVIQGCMTPEKWQQDFARAQQNQDCHMKNVKQDASGMSADIDCKAGPNGSTGHVQMTFVSPEKVHGTIHTETIMERNPQPVVMDITLDSVYQGSDCKGISPDGAKVVH